MRRPGCGAESSHRTGIAEGLDTLEIAQRLSYSERTVRNIIHGLLTRMKLNNRAHAVAYALRNGAM